MQRRQFGLVPLHGVVESVDQSTHTRLAPHSLVRRLCNDEVAVAFLSALISPKGHVVPTARRRTRCLVDDRWFKTIDVSFDSEIRFSGVPLGVKDVEVVLLPLRQIERVETNLSWQLWVNTSQIKRQLLVDEYSNIVVSTKAEHFTARIRHRRMNFGCEMKVMRLSLIPETLIVEGEKRETLEHPALPHGREREFNLKAHVGTDNIAIPLIEPFFRGQIRRASRAPKDGLLLGAERAVDEADVGALAAERLKVRVSVGAITTLEVTHGRRDDAASTRIRARRGPARASASLGHSACANARPAASTTRDDQAAT
jgi:hypothetical protein